MAICGYESHQQLTELSCGDSASQYDILLDKSLFPDFIAGGPFEEYRKNASFDWRKMKLILKNEKSLRIQHAVWSFMEKCSVFAHPEQTPTLDEQRRLTVIRTNAFFQEGFYDIHKYLTDSDYEQGLTESLLAYDSSFFIRCLISYGLFPLVIMALGTDRLSQYYEDCLENKIVGAYALTEVSHGTNALQLQTTATYNPDTDDFELNSPSFEAAKCWVGNLGKTCTHCIVFAQLVVGGQGQGLNLFLVPIRDPKTMEAYGGVVVGDLGEKVGLNGLDNGFVMFHKYRLPKVNLLSKLGDLNKNGEFSSKVETKGNKKMGATFGALSGGRVGICGLAAAYLTKALTIGIRYSASRKQFGPIENGPEIPVLEYQSQQYRLLPHLATTYAYRVFTLWLSTEHRLILNKSLGGEDISYDDLEIHALSSAVKAVCTWAARDGIQECREACGGHGYLKVSQIGDLRNDNDANCTYEGENNVLIQQASNWLLNIRKRGYEAFAHESPLGSASFMADAAHILSSKFHWHTIEEVSSPENLLVTLNWLCVYQLEKTADRLEVLRAANKSPFEMRNDSQTFNAAPLSILYAERTIFVTFYNRLKGLDQFHREQLVLFRLLSLYGLHLIVKHLSILYEGGFAHGNLPSKLYQDAILHYLPLIKADAIGLVDAIAPPDFILNSPLGMSDGDVYKHLETKLLSGPDALTRPTWWREIIQQRQSAKL